MEDEIIDDENYLTQWEKQVIIDKEIAKLLQDKPDYRKAQPSDKYNLSPITERGEGKFIHGQKWPIPTTPTKKLKSASRRMRSGQIKPKEPKKLRSMLFEATIIEFVNGEWVDSKILSTEDRYIKVKLRGYPFMFYIPVKKLLQLLNEGFYKDRVTGDEGNEKFVAVFQLDRNFLLGNDVVKKFIPLD